MGAAACGRTASAWGVSTCVSDAQVQIQSLGNDHCGTHRREIAAFGLERLFVYFCKEQDAVALIRPRRCLFQSVNIK